MTIRNELPWSCLVPLVLLGCATLATEAGDGDAPRPNALAGPFRLLRAEELDNYDAPYALKKKGADFREATLLDLEQTGKLGQSAAYALGTLLGNAGVYRFLASDGRSFDETPVPPQAVLGASEPWEGGSIDAPEVARVGDEIFLFYSAAGGIGLARSVDGVSFVKLPGPVLGTAGAPAWEAGAPPRAAAFVEIAPGQYRLFYEAAGRIGEAESTDAVSWTRRGTAAVLEPAPVGDPDAPAFDSARVGDPDAWVSVSAEGRKITRVYYTGFTADGASNVGLAARFGDSGSLERAPAPAFSGPRDPHAPSVVAYQGLTLLFVTQSASSSDDYPAVAVGIAPANVSIPVK